MSDSVVRRVSPAGGPVGIDAGVSSYLDLSRLGAALVVACSHLLPNLFGIDAVPGHDAVIVFFVISGYVISYAAEQRDRTLGRFVLNRLARLWSVLLPSLVLSAAAAAWVGGTGTTMFAPPVSAPDAFVAAALRNALFVAQNWHFNASAPFNDPVWSLNFEAWYYAIFAAWAFAPGRWRWVLAGGALLLAGPAIAVLMPGWLLGVWLFRRCRAVRLAPWVAYGVFAACVGGYALAFHFDLGPLNRAWLMDVTAGHAYRLRASTRFMSDGLNACLYAGTVIAVGSMPAVNRALARMRGAAKALSSRTFSIYLYHMPLLVLLHDGLGLGGRSVAGSLGCMGAVLGLSLMLGSVTEGRLPAWRRALEGCWGVLRGAVPRGAEAPSG